MLEKVSDREFQTYYKWLEQYIDVSFYMYIDALRYGNKNNNVEFWWDKNKALSFMRYYDSLQILSEENFELSDDILDFIKGLNLKMLTGSFTFINALFKEEKFRKAYNYAEGYNYRYNYFRRYDTHYDVSLGKVEDSVEIANLILLDDTFSHNYNYSTLRQQITDRINSGIGRSILLKSEEHLIGHIATFAESDQLAVTGGLVVKKGFRNQGLGFYLEGYLVNLLLSEGKKVYTQVNSKKRRKLLSALGFYECGRYAKLTRI